MADYDNEVRDYEDDRRDYDRDRSRSPRNSGNDNGVRARSASPNGRDRYENADTPANDKGEENTANPGSNLFVTGIAPRVTEEEVTRMFSEFGEVSSCNIMRDPHSGESRGFGFVKMASSEGADAAREGLSGKMHEGRTLSIEKARRGRPRTPTPGKYYGPPKRAGEDFRAARGGGRRFEPYDDRRRGYGGGGARRDEYYPRGAGGYGGREGEYSRGSGGYGRERYDDRYGGGDYGYSGGRSYGGGGRDREDYPARERGDRYGGGPREDRYGGPPRGDDRRGAGGYYQREERAGGGPRGSGGYDDRAPAGYTDPPPREPYQAGGARGYDDRDSKRA